MSHYLPICDYIDTKLDFMPRGTGIFVSLGSVMGTNYALHDAFNIMSVGGSVMPGIAGFLLAGGVIEKHLPAALNSRRVGLTKGGMILRGSQLGAAFMPMALSLGLHLTVMNQDRNDNDRSQETVTIIHEPDHE